MRLVACQVVLSDTSAHSMTKKILVIITTVLVAATALFAFQMASQPQLTWSPGRLDVSLSPGSTKTMEAAFISSYRLPSVSLQPSPEISRFVSVQLTSSSTISGKYRYVLRAVVSAPYGAQAGVYEGIIRVRIGNLTLPHTLKVAMTVLPVGVSSLPPDPGEAGKKTLAGIDSDRDGVRDDVQRYIALTYTNSAKTRAALRQVALGYQASVTQGNAEQLSDAIDCNTAAFMTTGADVAGGQRAREALLALKASVLNTPARAKAYFQADAKLGNAFVQSIPFSQKGGRCLINPLTLSN